jgi:hypothetical protein
MLTRYVAAAAAMFALASLGLAAHEPAPVEETHEIAIDQQVEIAQSMAAHEAVAQRFDTEAARFEKQATEYERAAKVYRGKPNGDLKTDWTILATHCERIAKKLKEAATEARDAASLHRNVSHKLTR